MASSISLTKNKKKANWNEQVSVYFDDSGADYCFLYPTLISEIKNKTGKLIDPYDDCLFTDLDFPVLQELIISNIEKINQLKEKEWNVTVGLQTFPEKKEIYKVLNKKELLKKLEKFSSMIQLAKDNDEYIISIGD